MERLTNGSWESCSKDELLDGDVYRTPSGVNGWHQRIYKTPIVRPPSRLVSPTDIALAFPSDSVAELNDYAWNTEKTLSNRGLAQQILYALKGNRDLDVLSDKFNDMLNFMVAEIPSYTTEANDAFKLQIGI